MTEKPHGTEPFRKCSTCDTWVAPNCVAVVPLAPRASTTARRLAKRREPTSRFAAPFGAVADPCSTAWQAVTVLKRGGQLPRFRPGHRGC